MSAPIELSPYTRGPANQSDRRAINRDFALPDPSLSSLLSKWIADGNPVSRRFRAQDQVGDAFTRYVQG